MRLIADRFAEDKEGHAHDLATGERVQIITTPMGGPTEHARWAERCAWLSRAAHPSLAPLVDYGMLGETHRFEAWAARPNWSGAPGAAAHARTCVAQFLSGNRRTPVRANALLIGTRHGRPCVIPDIDAGLESPDEEGPSTSDRGVLGVVREPDVRLQQAGDLLSLSEGGRLTAISIWCPHPHRSVHPVREIARAARLAGFVPISSRLCRAPWLELLVTRTLVLFAYGRADDGWRRLLEASLAAPKPHVVVFVGAHAVRRVHMVPATRWLTDALTASVQPEVVASQHRRAIAAAARRSGGHRETFERLLFGDSLCSDVEADEETNDAFETHTSSGAESKGRTRGTRAAEHSVPYLVHRTSRPDDQRDERVVRTWPAPSEVLRFRRLAETGRVMLARGRHQAGDRALRQATHAFARRSEWAAAAGAALTASESLMTRGLLRDVAETLDSARTWSSRANDLALVTRVAVATASLRLEQGHAVDAECVLETALEAAMSESSEQVNETLLALARCLYWQGRYADAWHRLDLLTDLPSASTPQSDSEQGERAGEPTLIRAWTLRARVAIGRGRAADGVACAARARDLASRASDLGLRSSAWYASALAQLAAGDAAQADAAAAQALTAARAAHHPLLAVRARLLRAELARRRGQRTPATILVKRLARLSPSLPHTVRARVELLRELLADSDVAGVTDRRARLSGLPALRLFTAVDPSAPPPAADHIVELLQCCQAADDDGVMLVKVCARVRARLGAQSAAFFAAGEVEEAVCVASDGSRIDPGTAVRLKGATALVVPHRGEERAEACVPVRYAGQIVGWLVAAWPPTGTWHDADVTLLMTTAATAAAPALAGLASRRRVSRRAGGGSEILGISAGIVNVRAAIEKAASAPFAVLVEGESGSGKELVARLLHKLGPRRDRPFSTLNCAALPDDLVESELFGHARGAFTGAVAERRGVFEEAHSGTLFLDEVGELSARAQAKLLRAIQEGEIRRVGENTCRRVDVRLVTATNRDLRVEAAAGRFRLDLLYRLDVIRIALPPLRERREDIAVLAEHFWQSSIERLGSRATLSSATLAVLSRYDWPGNIRELQNVLAALAVRSPRRGLVPPSALPPQFTGPIKAESSDLEAARRSFDRSFIRAALVRTGGHRAKAAAELGVSRQGLAKLMARLDIEDPGEAVDHA